MRLIDKHLWSIPVIAFALFEFGLVVHHQIWSGTLLMASLSADARKDIYSSLTGSSSGLLGFALAAVAILAAFGKKSATTAEERRREDALALARAGISKVLLVTSLFLMIVLIASTVGVGMDRGGKGGIIITSLVTSSSLSSLIGLVVSGAGLTLSLIERSVNA